METPSCSTSTVVRSFCSAECATLPSGMVNSKEPALPTSRVSVGLMSFFVSVISLISWIQTLVFHVSTA